ncbi:hypothetical protein ACH42_12830 [Endozoicomonas sp. (ex Bugula neritina AB1)]|nr:hypothetical protein ACH42_12830 [Endozoicomonas sp. (ex Bugula neritina AB1)]
MNPDKYRLLKALRPFSYSVAVVTCGLGVALAYARDEGDLLSACLVVIAGVLLQASSNLANDYADIGLWKNQSNALSVQVTKQIRRNFYLGGLLTLIAVTMGLWLVLQVGWPLMLLGLFGVLGGYSYTGEPINYKQRGLGVPAVFLFTGVLMVSGSYYAVTGHWSSQVVWLSAPVSLLSASLLMANEIRDYLEDQNFNIQTLTVRIGFEKSKVIYVLLLISVYPLSFYLFLQGGVRDLLYLLPSLAFVWQPVRLLFNAEGDIELVRLPPLTGRFFMVFGVGFICSVL